MLLVSMPTALIETARHQAIFSSQVQHLIIDDGDALYRGNSDQKAIYDIKWFFPDLPLDCLRFLFTVVPSLYSMHHAAGTRTASGARVSSLVCCPRLDSCLTLIRENDHKLRLARHHVRLVRHVRRKPRQRGPWPHACTALNSYTSALYCADGM